MVLWRRTRTMTRTRQPNAYRMGSVAWWHAARGHAGSVERLPHGRMLCRLATEAAPRELPHLVHEVVRAVSLEEARLNACALAVVAHDHASPIAGLALICRDLRWIGRQDVCVHFHPLRP